MDRPQSINVFGVLNIVFGALGLTCGLCFVAGQGLLAALRQNPNFRNPVLDQIESVRALKTWMMISVALQVVASIVLLVAGIGLLRLSGWGRVMSIGYSIYGLISLVVGVVINMIWIWIPQLNAAPAGPERIGAIFAIVVGMFSMLLYLTYYVLLWYFMTRPRVKAAFR
jgi:hypothetical protein